MHYPNLITQHVHTSHTAHPWPAASQSTTMHTTTHISYQLTRYTARSQQRTTKASNTPPPTHQASPAAYVRETNSAESNTNNRHSHECTNDIASAIMTHIHTPAHTHTPTGHIHQLDTPQMPPTSTAYRPQRRVDSKFMHYPNLITQHVQTSHTAHL